MCQPVDGHEDDAEKDMHDKIREGESSRAVNNVEVHCCPSLPLFPGLNLRRAPRLHQNNDVRLGDICNVLNVSHNLKVKLDKTLHSVSAEEETKRRISRSDC